VRHVGGGERFRKGDWKPANRIIERVVKEKRTFWRECRRRAATGDIVFVEASGERREPPPGSAHARPMDAAGRALDDVSQIHVTGVDPGASPELRSLEGIQAVVAAPILGRDGEVVGILYGDRVMADDRLIPPRMTKLDAMLVETLACATAAGLARLDQEKAALSAEVRFGQFFSPELSRHLASNPDMLAGRDTEVTVLFCDIRGFSRVTERLDPALTLKWINDVLGELSDCVIEQQGVLVDYVGDELVAMWGAPENQPDHALLAVQAALDMLGKAGKLDAKWQAEIGEPTRFGIGINTGTARVGNTGSRCKFKYGPLGNTVNLASRVQGATKHFQTDLLITAATHARLGGQFSARRLCQLRVVNIVEPVEIHELRALEDAGWEKLRRNYEDALRQFEQQDFTKAIQTLGSVIANFPLDYPSRKLLLRADGALQGQAFDPAVELPGK
jgi:adenylate cyclase